MLLLAVAGCGDLAPPLQPPPAVEAGQQMFLPEHLASLRRILLDLHNRERAEVGARPLLWDPALADAAAAYGPALASGGKLVHAPPELRRGQGENLWMGTRNRYSLESMFGGWAREKRHFRPGVFPRVTKTRDWRDVAHYTQVIWRGTERVGCAVHRKGEWDYLICRYSPAGNVNGWPVP